MDLLAYVAVIIVVALAILVVPRYWRRRRMRKLAAHFGFTYQATDRSRRWWVWTPTRWKENIISGEINGRSVEIQDVYQVGAGSNRGGTMRQTFVLVDHTRENLKPLLSFGLVSVARLRRFLSKLGHN